MNITDTIQEKLNSVCAEQGCSLLLAAESGSRAWGFASQTSDYDVRMLYVYPTERYIRLDDPPDDLRPELNEVYDISGWELRKALRLARKSNTALLEWCHSPIHYRESALFPEFCALVDGAMQPRRLALQYLGLCSGTFKRYLTRPEVPYKQYFYAIRPLLAARWALQERRPVPVPFAELRAALLPAEMQEEMDTLLALRSNNTEKATGPARPRATAYIERELAALWALADAEPACGFPDAAPLNDFLSRAIHQA